MLLEVVVVPRLIRLLSGGARDRTSLIVIELFFDTKLLNKESAFRFLLKSVVLELGCAILDVIFVTVGWLGFSGVLTFDVDGFTLDGIVLTILILQEKKVINFKIQ